MSNRTHIAGTDHPVPPRHGVVLKGNRVQCGECGAYFRSVSGFDRHRVGPQDSRGCLSPEGMVFAGMSMNDDGLWITATWTTTESRRVRQ